MSYNGTVNCRWCYQKGHNKRSCPEYTEILKKRALQEINDGEGYNGYWGKQYNKRVKKTGLYADGTAMSKEAIKAATKSSRRRCKYCAKQGHNRRTCPTLKTDKASWSQDQLAWRKKIRLGLRKLAMASALFSRLTDGAKALLGWLPTLIGMRSLLVSVVGALLAFSLVALVSGMLILFQTFQKSIQRLGRELSLLVGFLGFSSPRTSWKSLA